MLENSFLIIYNNQEIVWLLVMVDKDGYVIVALVQRLPELRELLVVDALVAVPVRGEDQLPRLRHLHLAAHLGPIRDEDCGHVTPSPPITFLITAVSSSA